MFYSSLPQPICLNPFGTGQCLSTEVPDWTVPSSIVSIPLEQGSVFRRTTCIASGRVWAVSIPLEQGSVFRLRQRWECSCRRNRLNPFGTGQCLSTFKRGEIKWQYASQSLWNRAVSFDHPRGRELRSIPVSIPLEQGSVFRLELIVLLHQHQRSQSLWNRAVSFDS